MNVSASNAELFRAAKYKEAKRLGYQARINGRPLNDNPIVHISRYMQIYASCWDAGWQEADQNIEQNETEIN